MVRRRRAAHAFVASLFVLGALDSFRAQSAPQDPWPPPGVYRQGQDKDVTPPRLSFEVRPQYPREAMRARIEGLVVLSCVVTPEGTVGPVRVVRSLDPDLGLDRAAIDALKQWRFEPARKDGTAVPFLTTIEMTFSLSSSRPVLEWPSGFSATGPPAGWRERDVAAANLQFRVAFPAEWEAHAGERPNQVFLVHDATGARTFSIGPPRPAPFQMDRPLPPDRLQSAVGALKGLITVPGAEVARVGQVRTGGRLWVWFEARITSLEAVTAAMPPEVADAMTFESGRMWFFSTTAGSQFVQVGASLLYRRTLSDKEIEDETARAGADFVRIIERLSITPR